MSAPAHSRRASEPTASSTPRVRNARRFRGRRAIVLAGGKGSRLGPYTTVLPKPLLPIGDRAILDVVVCQLRNHGFRDITFAVGYLSHLIQAVFANGSKYQVSIKYHLETQPLGTVGALAAMDLPEAPFLLMNGDVLTTLDYSALYRTHLRAGNVLTIATNTRTVKSEYGVLELDGSNGLTRRVAGYREKPETTCTVSMGVYVADRRIQRYIPEGGYFNFPDLVLALLQAGEPVGSYDYDGFWLDIGRHEDYERAIAECDELMPQLLRVPSRRRRSRAVGEQC
jgi:NDP-mannose synthase